MEKLQNFVLKNVDYQKNKIFDQNTWFENPGLLWRNRLEPLDVWCNIEILHLLL